MASSSSSSSSTAGAERSERVERAMSWGGHLHTLRGRLRRLAEPAGSVPWSTEVADPDLGAVRLSGALHPRGDDLVLLVHGLGGSAASGYMLLLAARAVARGLACLRLNLRGSDRLGEDYYHAGLIDDFDAVLAAPELARYARVYLLGCSLGGHLALRWAALSREPRVPAVAALCSPLDLAASSSALLRPALWLYRRYLMASLHDIYRRVAARRPVPVPVAEVRRMRTVKEWDERVVAPRWGFAGAADYYRRMSAAPLLPRLGLPALYVGAEDDPMVPPATVRPALAAASPALEVAWLRSGGHLGFPERFDLGLSPRPVWADQVLDWLEAC